MIVIYGTRHYGVVDRHQNEYAVTRVAHIYYLPLIPLGCKWVTASDGDNIYGYDIPLHARSITAAFLRPWGILLGGLGLIGAYQKGLTGGGIGLGIGALAVLALAITSMVRANVRGERALRERAFNRAAFGVGCDPAYMPADMVSRLRSGVEDEWARQADGRSPGDVARMGARSGDEAVLAWAVLRLGALSMNGARRREAEADAARILDGTRELPESSGSPYRDRGDQIPA